MVRQYDAFIPFPFSVYKIHTNPAKIFRVIQLEWGFSSRLSKITLKSPGMRYSIITLIDNTSLFIQCFDSCSCNNGAFQNT